MISQLWRKGKQINHHFCSDHATFLKCNYPEIIVRFLLEIWIFMKGHQHKTLFILQSSGTRLRRSASASRRDTKEAKFREKIAELEDIIQHQTKQFERVHQQSVRLSPLFESITIILSQKNVKNAGDLEQFERVQQQSAKLSPLFWKKSGFLTKGNLNWGEHQSNIFRLNRRRFRNGSVWISFCHKSSVIFTVLWNSVITKPTLLFGTAWHHFIKQSLGKKDR